MRHLPFTLSAGILPSAMPLLMEPTCSLVISASWLGVMNSGTSSKLNVIPHRPSLSDRKADGSEAEDFCRWCYENGVYTYETSMDEMIEDCAPRMAEAMGWTVDEAASLLGAVLPTLRRWREVAENEKTYGEETRAAYGDEVVDAANKKYLAMGEAAHLQAEELAVAINEQLRRAMEAGDPAGPEARKLVEMHGRWLRMYWPDGTYTPEAHKGLADGYVADERFQAYYEKIAPGAAQFLRDAIRACA